MLLNELFEGYWKNKSIDMEYDKSTSKKFNVMVNGKVWKKNGTPVVFSNAARAQTAADTIKSKYNKCTQVIPA